MGFVYVSVGLFGGLGSFLVKEVTNRYGFQTALFVVGALMFATWPLAMFLLKDKPAELGQHPDGAPLASEETGIAPETYRFLLRNRSFWLLLLGSICSIGATGSINMHMKFVFRDSGFTDQIALNSAWTLASALNPLVQHCRPARPPGPGRSISSPPSSVFPWARIIS